MPHHLFLVETPQHTQPGLTMRGAWTTYFGLRARGLAVQIVSIDLDTNQRTVLAQHPRRPTAAGRAVERIAAL